MFNRNGISASFSFAMAIIALLVVGGCSSKKVTISEWGKRFDRYAAEEANDDTSFLREASLQDAQRSFTILGTRTPEKSTDVAGLLLGRRNLNGSDWLVFLVGQVKQREVQDIRIALRSDDGGTPRWVFGDDADDAFEQYRTHQENEWRTRHPGRNDAPTFAYAFPAEADVFRLDVINDAVTITHEASQATWTLTPLPN